MIEGKQVTIILAEDDDGHAELVRMHLQDVGLRNPLLRFCSGDETLDFFFGRHAEHQFKPGHEYLLLLDIRMPGISGIEVLKRIKLEPGLKNMPVVMLTTTDDPREVEKCYDLGCNVYLTKPVEFGRFAETIRQLGLFIMVMKGPVVTGVTGYGR